MSYVSQQQLVFDNSSLANFKNWAQAISTAFSSAGWVQTADTGQVNWGSIASVPAAGSFVYEIWRPGDALQTGATQFFVKMEYGTTSGSPAAPRWRVSLGTNTTGAGVLSGVLSAVMECASLSSGNGSGATTSECNFSGDINRMGIMMWRTNGVNSGNAVIFVVERTKNVDGTDNSDGVWLCFTSLFSNSVSPGNQVITFGGAGAATKWFSQSGANIGAALFAITASGNQAGTPNVAFSNSIAVSPIFCEYGRFGNPLTELCIVGLGLVAAGVVFQTTLYGAIRTYIAVSNAYSAGPNNAMLAMRFD